MRAEPVDPRPNLALSHYAEGLGRHLERTSWKTNANWFTFKLSWDEIAHQAADNNMFEFYRHGECLTRAEVRYGDEPGFDTVDYYNTLAVENDDPGRDPDDYRQNIHATGSQWPFGAESWRPAFFW
jgi:hypothetical protein